MPDPVAPASVCWSRAALRGAREGGEARSESNRYMLEVDRRCEKEDVCYKRMRDQKKRGGSSSWLLLRAVAGRDGDARQKLDRLHVRHRTGFVLFIAPLLGRRVDVLPQIGC